MACVFSEILRILKLKDKSEIAAISKGVVLANPIANVAIDSKTKPPASGIRLSKRETNQPENGSPTSDATGMNSKMVPSWASL